MKERFQAEFFEPDSLEHICTLWFMAHETDDTAAIAWARYKATYGEKPALLECHPYVRE